MTAFQTFFRRERRAEPKAFAAFTVVCLVLLGLLALVQVAHVHPIDTDADHCQLCIVMHSAAPVAVTAAVVVMVQIEAPTPVFEPHAVTRSWQSQLFIRPPPSGC